MHRQIIRSWQSAAKGLVFHFFSAAIIHLNRELWLLYRWLIILYRSFYSLIVYRWYSLLVVLAHSMLRYSRDWFSLIFIDIFFVPDQNLDIIPFSTFEMWVYLNNFTTNPPLIFYPIFEMNLCSLIIFSWLMLIKFGIFKSNIDVWEWLLGTLLTRAMKGTSQGKYDTRW